MEIMQQSKIVNWPKWTNKVTNLNLNVQVLAQIHPKSQVFHGRLHGIHS